MRRLLLIVSLLLSVGLGAHAALLVGVPNPESEQRRAEFLNYDPFRLDLLQQQLPADLFPAPVTIEGMKQFNTVLYVCGEESMSRSLDDPAVQKSLVAQRAALGEYVRAGGGLVILVTGVRYPKDTTEQWYNALFADFGFKILHEGVWDAATSFTAPGTPSYGAQLFFSTTNITPHPVTQGVARICQPHYAHSKLTGCEGIAYDQNWTVVVAGEQTAKSYKCDPLTNDMSDTEGGTYPAAPPMAAVRPYGQGRVFVWSIHGIYSVDNYGNPLWPQIAETRGDVAKQEPSFGHQLLLNALRWTGQPSTGLAGFGGRVIPDKVEPVQFPVSVEVGPNGHAGWMTRAAKPPAPVAPGRGIIGAHTAYSDGQGTVREYAAVAVAAGLSWIVFTESLESLTADKLAGLVQDCAQVSAERKIYCVPGFEYNDVNGCRWAIYGEKVIFPGANLRTEDGTRILADGALEGDCNYPPRMLLTYDKLPGDPENMWWYYRMPVWIYDEGKLVADNLDKYLLAAQDLDELPASCFTRIHTPAAVADAAGLCTTNLYGAPRALLDTRCATWSENSSVSQGGAGGPQIETFSLRSGGGNYYLTDGMQRMRGYFRCYAAAGLKEIKIYDGTSGVVRRYLPGGIQDCWCEFEMAFDRQHYLVLEATDTAGRRAVWTELRVFSYKQGFFRCGDNLNLLSSTPTVAHPDRHEIPMWPLFEDHDVKALHGFDTGSGVLTQPQGWNLLRIITTDGQEGGSYGPKSHDDLGVRILQVPGRFPLAGPEINVWTMHSENTVKMLWPSPAEGPFMPIDKPLPYANVDWRVTLLRSRLNYMTTWDHRRAHEGSVDYRGDIFLHQVRLTFTKDVTLKGKRPIQLIQIGLNGATAANLADHFAVVDKDKGLVEVKLAAGDKMVLQGAIQKYGYVTGYPTDAGALALVPLTEGFSYATYVSTNTPESLVWSVEIALGQDGQKFKAGDTLDFSFLAVTIPAKVTDVKQALADVAADYGLTQNGYSYTLDTGKLVDMTALFTVQAENHEVVASFAPQAMMVDRPFRITGLEDNGCAAVYVVEGPAREQHYRYVPVLEGAALFQQYVDSGVKIWAGNVFYADNPALKLTLVADGLTADEKPFLEIHNPTDQAVTATIQSPQHAPKYGGFNRKVEVPAGNDVKVAL